MYGWKNFVGNEWTAEMLGTAIRQKRLGHAYLITGPGQVGKTTLARLFAQALNCDQADPHARPCGQCRSCTLIATDRHPDVILLVGEESGRGRHVIKIDQIRELQAQLNLTPAEAQYKVAIIREFSDATPGASNALLKTLEEPANNVILILTAIEADTLLPTVVSRCRQIALRPVSCGRIEQALIKRWRVDPPQARLISRLAQGRVGWAVEAARDGSILDSRSRHLETLQTMLGASRIERFSTAEVAAGEPESLPEMLRIWTGWWRDLLLTTQGGTARSTIANIDQVDSFETLAQKLHPRDIRTAVIQTEEAIDRLARKANTRLVIENLLLAYPKVGSIN